MSNGNSASRILEGNVIVRGRLTAKNLSTDNEWTSYTPTVLSGGTFATSATLTARWRLQGTTLHINFYYSDSLGTGGVSSGSPYKISLPTGVTFGALRQGTTIGTAYATEATTPKNYTGVALADGTTTPAFTVVLGNEATTPAAWGNNSPLATALNFSAAAAKTIGVSLAVEIEKTSAIYVQQAV